MAKDFEVGKFYEVQVTPFSSKKIPALCTRVLKRKVEFQYLMRNRDGTLSKAKVSRCMQVASKDNPASAYSPDVWSGISSTTADMEANKPSAWDSVSE